MNSAEHPGNENGRLPHDNAERETIDRAQGAMMAAHGCTAQVAAGILSGVARSSGTGLRTVAETVVAVVDGLSQSPPEAIRAAITCALRDVLP